MAMTRIIILCVCAALLVASCTSKDKPTSGTPTPPDTVAPVVQLSSPVQSDTADQHLDITVSATDSVGVTMVDFYVDSTRVGARIVPPWTYRWNCACVAAESHHRLYAMAYDAAGNVGFSDTVAVFIQSRPAFTALNWQGTSILYDSLALKKDHSLLFVLASWCSWCRRLKSQTLVDSTVIRLLGESFTIAQIDPDSDSLVAYTDGSVSCRFMANTIYRVGNYPTIIILNAKGVETGRLIGYYDPSEFTGILDSIRCITSL
jgi:hypothetical protein